jgi:hypothetical protein
VRRQPEGGSSTDDGGGGAGSGDAAAATTDGTAGGAPTWTYVFETYFKGTCLTTCHVSMTAPRPAYAYMASNLSITNLATSSSCLVWFGPNGDMPLGATSTSNPQAVADITAWAAAGHLDN